MTRLAALPPHLSGNGAYEPDPVKVAMVGELRMLRAALSLCAARLSPAPARIKMEIERIESIVVALRELAATIMEGG